jgi:short-subunit dehydrogenase
MASTQDKKNVALVTGASSGIGREIARNLGARKIDLILSARRTDRLDALAEELRQGHGIRVDVVTADLSRSDGPQQLYERVRQLRADVSILVNNAGFGLFGPVLAHTPEALSTLLQVNVTALSLLTRLFAADMKAAGHGYVLQLSSIGAFQPSPLYAAYSAAKSYVLSFSYAMNQELAGTGVSITSTCPGFTVTEFHDVAQHEKTRLMKALSMSAERVAELSVRAMLGRKPMVVPGFLNRINSLIMELLPRRLSTTIAAGSVR